MAKSSNQHRQTKQSARRRRPVANRMQSHKQSSSATHATAQVKLVAMPYTYSIMQIAIGISVFIHIIFLSIHFESELRQIKDRLPVLEVTLVNTKTHSKPKAADIYAQANLDRGGNTKQDRQMTSALPAATPSQQENTINAHLIAKSTDQSKLSQRTETMEESELKRLEKLEKKAQSLIVQLRSSATVETKKIKSSASAKQKKKQEKSTSALKKNKVNQAMLEMERLEAKIAKQYEEYQKRPKRKFIGARAKEYRYAVYVDKWRQKVEAIGNDNYPQAAKKLNLYGKLQMTVSIKQDGSIEKIELDRSSGHRVLDAAAQHIVELGAPYDHFPDNIKNETDILSITRTWTFTKEHAMRSEMK